MRMLSPETAINLMQTTQVKDLNNIQIKGKKNLEEVARDFEAVFISEMIKPMFEGIETNGIFGGGKGEEIFRGMMIQEYGKEIARKNITNIQTQVMNKLIEIQSDKTQQNQTSAIQNNAVIDAEFSEKTVTRERNT